MKLKCTCMWMAAILVVALASPAGAATRTWDNDAGDNDWFTIANWDSISAFSPDELTNNYHIRAGISELEVIGKVVHIGTWDAQSDSDVTFYDHISSPGDLTGTGAVMFLADYAPKLSAAAVSFGGYVMFGPATTLQIELGGLLGGYATELIPFWESDPDAYEWRTSAFLLGTAPNPVLEFITLIPIDEGPGPAQG